MKRKRTRLGIALTRAISVCSGIMFVIGSINDIFGLTQLIGENSETLWGIIYTIGVFLVVWRKWVLFIFIISLAMFLIISQVQKKDMDERLTRNLSWFDAQRRNTKYSGGGEYLYKLKQFFKQKDVEFSWWAVTGVAGIGKTRLVLEALRDEDFSNADVQWLRHFDDYREKALKERLDSILEQTNYRNIIIAEDAQIYMDKIGTLIEYILGKNVSELRKHKIRLLLLIRMGEDEDLRDRYKQLASKTRQSILQKTRFCEFNKELEIEKYNEEDIAEIVKSYAAKTKKKRREKKLTDKDMSDLQTKTIQTLTTENMDSQHMRPLFAMFIADAILSGKDPMSWNREDILEYAVIEREDEFLQLEARDIQKNDNFRIFEKIRGIICLSIIRNGLPLSELDDIKKDLEEELWHSGIGLKDFLKEMQMIEGDDTVCITMPDILSEYYVLRSLVIEPDKDIVKWIIGQLCKSLNGADVSRRKIRQDYRYLYSDQEIKLNAFYQEFFKQCDSDTAFEIIEKVLSEQDLNDSNYIIIHEAIGNQIRNKVNEERLSKILVNMISRVPEMKDKRSCLGELKRLSEENSYNAEIVTIYSHGIVNMIINSLDIEEKKNCLSELERLYNEYEGNAEIGHAYSKGAFLLIKSDNLKLKEKMDYLSELKRMAGKNDSDIDIVIAYSVGLVRMIEYVSDTEKKNEYLSELKRLFEANSGNDGVAIAYLRGMLLFLENALEKEEKRNYLSKIEKLSKENPGNSVISISYCEGLSYMFEYTKEIEEKRSRLSDLKNLSDENIGNADIALAYSKMLFNMIIDSSDIKERKKCLDELKRLSEEYNDSNDIIAKYSHGLFNMRNHAIKLEEKVDFLSELKRLFEENVGNTDVAITYGYALVNMLGEISNLEEKRVYLSKLKFLAEENFGNLEIALEYVCGLVIALENDEEYYDHNIGELHRMMSDKRLVQYTAKKRPSILTYTRRVLLDFEYENGIDDIETI